MAATRQPEERQPRVPPSSPMSGGSALERTPNAWWWWVIAGLFVLILGLGIWDIFDLIARPLALVVLSLTLAFALAPAIAWMEKAMPRVLAIVIVYIIILAIIVGLGYLIIPRLITEAQQISDQAPQFIQDLQQFIPGSQQLSTESLINTLGGQLGNLGSMLVQIPLQIGSYLFDIFLWFIISAYLLAEGPRLLDFILTLFPEENREEVDRLLVDMGSAMGGYIRGTIISGVIIGTLVYIGLLLLGVRFPLILAVQAGLFELIPNIGPILSAIPIGLVALTQSTTKALLAVGYLTLIQQIEGWLIIPFVMRSQTKISPLMVILALVIGGGLGGILGVLVAIPLTAALRIFVLRVAAPTIRGWMGVDEPEEQRHENS